MLFPLDSDLTLSSCLLWWHVSATRYEIAIVIILESYRDKTNYGSVEGPVLARNFSQFSP